MATNPNAEGMLFKIAAVVDPQFQEQLRNITNSTKGVSLEGNALTATLKKVQQQFKTAGLSVKELDQALARSRTSQNGFNAGLKEGAAATREADTAVKSYAQSLRDVEAATNKAAGGTGFAIGQFSKLSGSLKGLGGLIGDSDFGAAGRLVKLGVNLSSIPAPAATATLAVSGVVEVLKTWEDNQKTVGDAILSESRQLAEVTQGWHKYADAIKAALSANPSKPGSDFNFPFKQGANQSDEDYRKQLANKVRNLDVFSVAQAIRGPKISEDDQVAAAARASKTKADEALAKLNPVLETLYGLLSKGNQNLPDLSAPPGSPRYEGYRATFLKGSKHYDEISKLLTAQGLNPDDSQVSTKDLSAIIKRMELQKKELTDTSISGGLVKQLDQAAKLKNLLTEVEDKLKTSDQAFTHLPGREPILQSIQYDQKQLAPLLELYKKTGRGVDDASLATSSLSQNPEERNFASRLIAMRDRLVGKQGRLDKFDVSQLEEGLQLRRVQGGAAAQAYVRPESGVDLTGRGDSAFSVQQFRKSGDQDELNTINSELGILTGEQNQAERTRLLERKSRLNEKMGSQSFEDTIEPLRAKYEELKASGAATSGEILKANNEITAATRRWVAENGNLVATFDSLRDKSTKFLDALASDKAKDKALGLKENLDKMKQSFADANEKALTFQARLAENGREALAVQDAINKGTIQRKAGEEQLVELTKQRTALEREVLKAQEAQAKVLDGLRGKLVSSELGRLENDKANGRDPAFYESRREQLQAEEVRSKLKVIDDEYKAAKDSAMGQVLAAQEASMKKKLLYQEEADKFVSEEDRKTNALKAANKARLGGEASPLMGFGEGLGFSGVSFSGFGNFGDNFGHFSRSKSAFDTWHDQQLPGAVGDIFKSRQSYENIPQPKTVGDTHVYFNPNVSPTVDVKHAVKRVGQLLADTANRTRMSGGPDSLSSSADNWQDG